MDSLEILLQKSVEEIKRGKEKDRAEEQFMKQYIPQEVDNIQDETLSRAENMFFSQQLTSKTCVTFAKVLIMLSGDSPLSSVLSFRSHQVICDIIHSMVTTRTLGPKVAELRKYSYELLHLFQAAIEKNIIGVIVSFVLQLINRIEFLHNTKNRPTPEIEKIPNSYNPSKELLIISLHQGIKYRRCLDMKK